MAVTAYGDVPNWLVSPAATTAASATVAAALLMSLVLALVQMKTEKLSREVRSCAGQRGDKQLLQTQAKDSDQPASKRRNKPRKSRLRRMVLQFLIAGDESEDEVSVTEVDQGPYQMDDGCWVSPEDAVKRMNRPAEHFIGESSSCAVSPEKKSQSHEAAAGAWELADHYWREPPASAESS
eukprot:TRINITY_DN72985_c0_g1_i1.p1 TRINITY_DN72985_c0_g1~~TRINITY_DN72985_c0_g1_i1.p1  ORF type:complete len:181 (-),score=34.61 TRINITY_DN72985_c0_g1_i1:40-582(-)